MTDDGEVELNLSRETVEEQIRTSEDIRKPPGAINPGTMALDQEERHRFEPPNGARSKWPFRVFWSLVVQGRELGEYG